MFDTRGALDKVMSRVARQLTAGLRASAQQYHWPDSEARKLSVRVNDQKLYFYANTADVDAAQDLEYGTPGEPPKPAMGNYFEGRANIDQARRLITLEAREFVKEFDRVLGRI